MGKVILSSSIIFEPGTFVVERWTLSEAKEWVNTHNPKNYSTHDTVKILGIEPRKSRASCSTYVEALCLKPNERLDFGRQYTQEEIEEVGVKCFFIRKVGENYDI